MLPCDTKGDITFGYAVHASDSHKPLARVVRDDAGGTIVLVGRGYAGLTEVVIWELGHSADDTEICICRFEEDAFCEVLKCGSDIVCMQQSMRKAVITHSPTGISTPQSLLKTCPKTRTSNISLLSEEKRDAPCLLKCLKGVSRLGILKREGACMKRFAHWVMSIASAKKFVCPAAMLMNAAESLRGSNRRSSENAGAASATTIEKRHEITEKKPCWRRLSVNALLSDDSTCDMEPSTPKAEMTTIPVKQESHIPHLEALPEHTQDKHLAPLQTRKPVPLRPAPPPQEIQPQRRLPRLAPAPAHLRGTTCAGVVPIVQSNVQMSEMDERRRKAELRKARNRESAQRSNYKRKMRLLALKEELERISLKEKVLRAREKDLRQENISLRMTVPR